MVETYNNNHRRRHSTFRYLTPKEYELGYRNISDIMAQIVSNKGTLHLVLAISRNTQVVCPPGATTR
jgi:hypothetical protein